MSAIFLTAAARIKIISKLSFYYDYNLEVWCLVFWQVGIHMLEEPANTETLVCHVYEIIQCHGQKDCNVNIQLLWEPYKVL